MSQSSEEDAATFTLRENSYQFSFQRPGNCLFGRAKQRLDSYGQSMEKYINAEKCGKNIKTLVGYSGILIEVDEMGTKYADNNLLRAHD